jgi:hypothetical protein
MCEVPSQRLAKNAIYGHGHRRSTAGIVWKCDTLDNGAAMESWELSSVCINMGYEFNLHLSFVHYGIMLRILIINAVSLLYPGPLTHRVMPH